MGLALCVGGPMFRRSALAFPSSTLRLLDPLARVPPSTRKLPDAALGQSRISWKRDNVAGHVEFPSHVRKLTTKRHEHNTIESPSTIDELNDMHKIALDKSALRELWKVQLSANQDSPTISSPYAQRAQYLYHAVHPPNDMGPKLCQPLDKRDFKAGRLYIFRRASSPGYVKIGWTMNPIERRLNNWSRKCGYRPILAHSTDVFKYTQRAETLAHEELAWERRKEPRCAGCGKGHTEWFRVSEERAIQVVDSWASLMTYEDLYDEHGRIKISWTLAALALAQANSDVRITAERLLYRHKALEMQLRQGSVQGVYYLRRIVRSLVMAPTSIANPPSGAGSPAFSRGLDI
ncbi:meiotically up-regulated gene 113-domain-containing protein [Microdochium trichocladiopsis]|uniref:Meiotically up-regulated gene 113-domain-containing protein n=1 Tax=Microdochium trichocladiopsis TaxID=1682393 RepID=A0A9P8XT85_9PEZI|nr:meiotically up-regulated gene 113-domain-containing protein [Microdochium trichocladiopsis]KAH7010859.1 meiotically up-regulated gene 113-domain-containing protein [Microdochium trichocladiopsis]